MMRLSPTRLLSVESPAIGGAYTSGRTVCGSPVPLHRNVRFAEVLSPRWVLEPPNYQRRPLWRQWWEAQFSNRSFLFFGNAWSSAAAFAALLWWSRVFGMFAHESLFALRSRGLLLKAPMFRMRVYYLSTLRPTAKDSKILKVDSVLAMRPLVVQTPLQRSDLIVTGSTRVSNFGICSLKLFASSVSKVLISRRYRDMSLFVQQSSGFCRPFTTLENAQQ